VRGVTRATTVAETDRTIARSAAAVLRCPLCDRAPRALAGRPGWAGWGDAVATAGDARMAAVSEADGKGGTSS